MNIRCIIDAAIEQIETCRTPDIDEAQALINSILQAANLGTTGKNRIERMRFRSGFLDVRSCYAGQRCDMSRDFHIPVAIIDADDPIKAASRWAVEKELKEARNDAKHAEERLHLARERLQRATNAMHALDACESETV